MGSPLDSKLASIMGAEAQRGLICQLCEPMAPTEDDVHSMQPYFQYYSTQCRQFLLDGGTHVSVSTHNHIVHLASIFHKNRARGDILQLHAASSADKAVDTEAANCSINLCARLLLMVDIGEPPNGLPGPNAIHWESGTLADFAESCFGVKDQLNPENAKIGKMLTMLNLQKIGGMDIE